MLRQRPTLAASINLAVLAVVVYLLARSGLDLYRSWKPSATEPAAAVPAGRGPGPVSLTEIVNAQLFGRPTAGPVVVAAPETRLQLRLSGVMASNDGRHAAAVISVESGPAQAYRVGEVIEGTDARVQAVQADHVVLERGGRQETLSLEKPQLQSAEVGDTEPLDDASLPQPVSEEPGKEDMLERFREELKKRGQQAASQ
ncbi:MAG: hypothetical protein LJE84_13420 [Gammaproteobacteria bacterium]|nr:hypothetical protein [Gammaproteobacteria bacterium]